MGSSRPYDRRQSLSLTRAGHGDDCRLRQALSGRTKDKRGHDRFLVRISRPAGIAIAYRDLGTRRL